MLSRAHRIRDPEIIRSVMRGTTPLAGQFFDLYKKRGAPPFKAAVIAGKKISKKSVHRNRVRRRLYEAVREMLPRLDPELKIIIVARPNVVSASYQYIKKELERAITQ